MELSCRPMDSETAQAILNWTYEPPYDFYNLDGTSQGLSELMNGTYQAIFSDRSLIGFYCFGEAAQVPAGREVGAYPHAFNSPERPNRPTKVVDIGLGLRPDLTGRGFGTEFMRYILARVQTAYPTARIRLTVAVFNQRAIHLYEKLRFIRIQEFDSNGTVFQTMMKSETTKSISEALRQTKYQLAGHGKRNVQVLLDAFSEVSGDLNSDIYGRGPVIEAFQQKMATFLGKEAAVFSPSGTMAQQIAMRIWCDRTGLKKVAYHPLCHMEIHEQNGLHMLHNIESVLLAEKDRVIELDDIVNMKEDISCVLLELPQREIGGQLPTYKTLVDISTYCRDKGIKLHLDGARLYEVLPYYQKTAAELSALFDSVYISFYKGIGGIAGAILAGNKDFIDESIVWKRRYGGDLISLYPYILSADYYFDQRIDKMSQYYDDARELAPMFHIEDVVWTLPEVPVSNMFHVHFNLPKDKVEPLLVNIYETTDIGFTAYLNEVSAGECSFELSVGDQYRMIPSERLKLAFDLLRAGILNLTTN